MTAPIVMALRCAAVEKLKGILRTFQDQDGEDVLETCDPDNLIADSFDFNSEVIVWVSILDLLVEAFPDPPHFSELFC